jgi:hypothetical protein
LSQDQVFGIQSDETEAAEFFCDIYDGNLPQVFEDIGSDLVGDLEDFSSFVVGLTTLAPAILSDIVQGGDDVVSVVGELFTDPGDAITVIVGGIETAVEVLWGDFTNVACDILGFIGLCTPQSVVQASSIADACYASTNGQATIAFTTVAAAITQAAPSTAATGAVPTTGQAAITTSAASSYCYRTTSGIFITPSELGGAPPWPTAFSTFTVCEAPYTAGASRSLGGVNFGLGSPVYTLYMPAATLLILVFVIVL